MYYEPPERADEAGRQMSAWCIVPMWLAIIPLLGLGLWWPQEVWTYFGQIAHALGGGALVAGVTP